MKTGTQDTQTERVGAEITKPIFEDFSLLGAAGILFALYIVFRLWRAVEQSGGL